VNTDPIITIFFLGFHEASSPPERTSSFLKYFLIFLLSFCSSFLFSKSGMQIQIRFCRPTDYGIPSPVDHGQWTLTYTTVQNDTGTLSTGNPSRETGSRLTASNSDIFTNMHNPKCYLKISRLYGFLK
jgi:hypothetical protein